MRTNNSKRWWQRSTAVITTSVGLLTALLGLLAVLIQIGVIGNKQNEDAERFPKTSEIEEKHVDPDLLIEKGIILYDNGDYRSAFDLFMQAAEFGNQEAQWHVGEMMFHGEGVVENIEEGFNWITKAAQNGYAPAQSLLGGMLLQGKNIPKDSVEAERWISLGARQGDPAGQLLKTNLLFKQDSSKALIWLKKSAQSGHPVSQRLIGSRIVTEIAQRSPHGILDALTADIHLGLIDLSEAHYWLHRSARQGESGALLILGSLYQFGHWEDGTLKDLFGEEQNNYVKQIEEHGFDHFVENTNKVSMKKYLEFVGDIGEAYILLSLAQNKDYSEETQKTIDNITKKLTIHHVLQLKEAIRKRKFKLELDFRHTHYYSPTRSD